MVVIAGDIPTHYYGKHPHQEVNLHADAAQWEIYPPFVKRAWRVDRADLIAEILEKAFHLAESGQPGPVLVNVPMDIFSAVISSETFDRIADNTRTLTKPSIDDETARQIVQKLAEGRGARCLCRRRYFTGAGVRGVGRILSPTWVCQSHIR